MDKIHNFSTNDEFPTENIELETPTYISIDNYFIKYLLNNEPLYVQTPKCTTKQGVIKGSKISYCDLLFSNENNHFIKWIEDLEHYSQKNIFENKKNWFNGDISLDDIENSFKSSLKIFKSGMFYVLRTIIPTRLGKYNIKVFDEEENNVDIETLDTTDIIPILEFQGIKCSKNNMQVQIEIKQIMVLKKNQLFETCIINKQEEILRSNLDTNYSDTKDSETEDSHTKDNQTKDNLTKDCDSFAKHNVELHTINNTQLANITGEKTGGDYRRNFSSSPERSEGETKKDLDAKNNEFNNNECLEIKFDHESINEKETVKIRERNDIYYQIYYEAISRAKDARCLAIKAYIEAKHIKNVYKLDDILEDDIQDFINM
jgi:hypothetical protein